MDNFEKYIERIEKIVGKDNVKINEPMKNHTTFRVGGNADLFVIVDTFEKIQAILDLDLNIPITVIGNGSNVLVKDSGIRGIVIKYIANEIKIKQENELIIAEVDSGVLNAKLSNELIETEATGFEFASGIPGTIGGAIYMNAGAYGKEMIDIIKDVTYIDLSDNTVHKVNKEECRFGYRKSVFMEKDTLIVKATFTFAKGKKDDITKQIENYRKRRIETQPVEYPNGGSTFKRGNGFITAKLIDEAGLKGTRIGDAEVSEKHAGFIINRGNATAEDILKLVEYVQDEVYKKFKKRIDLEVRVLG